MSAPAAVITGIYVYLIVAKGRVNTCLENLEMSGNYTNVREMSGISLKVMEMSGNCQGKICHGKLPKN